MFRRDWHQADCARGLVRHYQAALDAVLAIHPRLQRCVRFCSHCGIRFLTHPRNVWRDVPRCPFGCSQQHRRRCASRRSTAYYQTAAGKGKKKTINGRRCGCPNVSSGHHPRSPDHMPPDQVPPNHVPPNHVPPNHVPPNHVPPDAGLPDNHASPEPATPDAATQAESAAAANSISCGHDTPAATADPVEQETSDSGGKLRVAGVMLDEARLVRSPVLPYIRMVASLIEGRHSGLAELIQALRNAVRQHKLARRRRVDYVLQCLNQHPP